MRSLLLYKQKIFILIYKSFIMSVLQCKELNSVLQDCLKLPTSLIDLCQGYGDKNFNDIYEYLKSCAPILKEKYGISCWMNLMD